MPERSATFYRTADNVFDTYHALGPIMGPGFLDYIEIHLRTSATAETRLGVVVTRGPEETPAAFDAGVPVFVNPLLEGGTHPHRVIRIFTAISRGLDQQRFSLGVSMVAGRYFVLMFTATNAAGSRRTILSNVFWRTRGGSGRRSGDLAIQVAPAGAGVLTSLQAEARRASGRNGK